MSWLPLEQIEQLKSIQEMADCPLRIPLGPRNTNTLKPRVTIKKAPNKPLKKNNKQEATGKFSSFFQKKIEETKEFVIGSLLPNTRQTQRLNIQADSSMQVAWYEEPTVSEFPTPDFVDMSNKEFTNSTTPHVLSPLTHEEQKLPLPVTPIQRNRPVFTSPTRARTPGRGILSPATQLDNEFQSPEFKDLFAQETNKFTSTFTSCLQEMSSFSLLDEECGYDSEDYSDNDERFPIWSHEITELHLGSSTKSVYDECFTARRVADILPSHVVKGKSSAEFDIPLQENQNEYATIESFQIGKPVGAGKFGTIYLARVRKRKNLFAAIKVMFKTCLTKGHITQLLREINHLDTLRSRNIISLYDFFHDEDRIYLVMEYANGGDLYHTLSSRQRLSEFEAAEIFKQAVEAIKVCHDHGIVHRDIKPENFVWGARKTLKLIDFGWSAPCNVGERRQTLCGTLDYLPPEMVTSKPYGQMADTWCLGVLLFELLTGSPPFEDEDYLVTKLNIKYVSYTIPDYISNQAKNFISDILKADPLSRPTLQQLLSHPWMKSHTL